MSLRAWKFESSPGHHQILCFLFYIAQVAELVDALASGASILTGVEVRVFSWAPSNTAVKAVFLFPLPNLHRGRLKTFSDGLQTFRSIQLFHRRIHAYLPQQRQIIKLVKLLNHLSAFQTVKVHGRNPYLLAAGLDTLKLT